MSHDSIGGVACPSEQSIVDYVEHVVGGEHRRQIDAHIDGCARCQAAVGELAAVLGGPEQPALYGGRYEVVETLGAGAMGIVYAAHDRELDRRVALKVLSYRPGFEVGGRTGSAGVDPDARSVQRARREARTLAQLRHPNVVDVYDVGPSPEGLFIAMELVVGQTLRAWLTETPRHWSRIVDVFVECAQALAAAHEAGIVHRDFKPDNVMVADAHAKVLDFGLARGDTDEAIDTSGTGTGHVTSDRLTRTGIVMGTPRYLAPELHLGERAGPRSDQYAFFVALYEAIAGRAPFSAHSVDALARAKRAVPDLTDQAWSIVPRSLRAAVQRGLAVDPEDRFADMGEVVRALERSAARRSWVPYLVGVVALASSAGLWLSSGDRERPEGGGDAWAEAERPDDEQALRELVIQGATLVDTGKTEEGLQLLLTVAERAQAREATWVEARARLAIGAAHNHLGQDADAEPFFLAAYEIARVHGYDPLVIDAATWLAKINAGRLEQPQRALEWWRHAAAASQRIGADPNHDADLLLALGKAALATNDLAVALEHFRGASECGDDSERSMALLNMGVTLRGLDRDDEAIGALEQGIRIIRDAGEEETTKMVNAQLLLAMTFFAAERAADANRVLEQTLAKVDRDPTRYLLILDQVWQARGSMYASQERWPESLAAFEAGRAHAEKHIGPDSQAVLMFTGNLAYVSLLMEDCDKALEYATEGINFAETRMLEETDAYVMKAREYAEQARECLAR